MFCIDYEMPQASEGLKKEALRSVAQHGASIRRLMPVTVPIKHGIPSARDCEEILGQLRELKSKRKLGPTIARPLCYGFDPATNKVYASLQGDIQQHWQALHAHLKQMGFQRRSQISLMPQAVLVDLAHAGLRSEQVAALRRTVDTLSIDYCSYFHINRLISYRLSDEGWADIQYVELN